MKITTTLWILTLQFVFSTSSLLGQYNFNSSTLQNAIIANPTSLQFGPDNKLYVAQQDGTIKIFTIVKDAPGTYRVTNTETILLVKRIPNHFDNGSPKVYNINTNKRQVTGICLAGTASNPIIYVASSDNDIGAGSAGDKDLCTNSGILSKLTKNGTTWTKTDLVRGLPRSEENHAPNGLVLNESKNVLYLTVAGFTNAGGPSKLFTYITEYALSACILEIDLNAIESLPLKNDVTGSNPYKYDLPTLDDPTRSNNTDGSDINDPWGGNDGLNQAKIIPGGPVKIFASGFRNPYDVLLTKAPGNAGKFYTVDNGANQNWGGHPHLEGTTNVTNNYVTGEPGSASPGVNDPMVNNLDGFHFIGEVNSYVAGSYYGGHPCPIRANPSGAGLFTHEGSTDAGTGVWRTSKTHATHPLPSDWPPVPVSTANPIESDFQNPGETNKALLTFTTSANGLCEYTASNFNNALKGNIFVACFDGNIHRIKLGSGGNTVLNQKGNKKVNSDAPFASGFGSKPLDITAQGDQQIFPGSMWVAAYASNTIVVFEPSDISCAGNYSNLDEDADHYTNADEIDNGTNPCSAVSKPNDNDQDFTSDKTDADDDNDGLSDADDHFPLDAQNGLTKNIPFAHSLFNNDPGYGFFGLGFTGIMSNGQTDYLNLYDENHLIAGGAIGAFTIDQVPAGDALGNENNQQYAFQLGVNVNSNTAPFIVHTKMLGSFFNNQPGKNFQSQGLYIGKGDQDNYLKIVLNANNGAGGIQVTLENAGVANSTQYNIASMPSSSIDLYLKVNPAQGTVLPRYSIDGGAIQSLGNPIPLSGSLLSVLQGPSALAIGIISTSRGSNTPFNATWDFISVEYDNQQSSGNWNNLSTSDASSPTHRHENAYVQAGEKFYLIGGRGTKPVQIYDPQNKTWKNGATPPVNLHHFQAVEYKGLIYAAGAFTGNYPDETPLPNIYIYDPKDNKWYTGPEIPTARRRGSCGTVVYNNKIYLVGGIVNGHNSGYVDWFDEFDPVTNTWKILPNAPHQRDHFHAVVYNDKIYLASGRKTSLSTGKLFNLTVPEVDVFSFSTNSWSTLSVNLPTQRAGASSVILNDELLVIGGESISRMSAHNETEALNILTNTWRSLDTLNKGRHGTQAIVNNGGIYIACGNGSRGGGAELNNQEVFYFGNATQATGTSIVKSKLSGPSEINFGSVPAGSSKKETLVLSNTEGNQALLVHSIAIQNNSQNAYSFSIANSLPFIILPGKSLSIEVTYSAQSSTAPMADLIISHSGINGNTSVKLGTTTTNPPTAFTPIVFVNAGGNELADPRLKWNSDLATNPSSYSNYSQTYNKTTFLNFTGTNTTDAPNELFSSYRWDGGVAGDPLSKEMRWIFPLPNGNYTVHLYFVENWTGATTAGKRVFDVLAEGQVVLNDYDIFADAGFNKAVKKSFNISVADGNLNFDFIHIIQNPRINGIAIYTSAPANSLSFSPGALNFSTQAINQSANKTVSLSNVGNSTLEVLSMSLSGTNASEFSLKPISAFALQPGNDSMISLQFKPTSKGIKNATLVIQHAGSNNPTTIPLSGEGIETLSNPVVIYRVNTGGYELPSGDTSKIKWGIDTYSNPSSMVNFAETGNKTFSTGDPQILSSTVPLSTPKNIFQSERSISNYNVDLLRWEFPVAPGGEVEVRLYFSEIYFNEVGQRIFDIQVEDSVALKNYDIYKEVGHDVGTMKSFVATSDGNININLIRVKQNPKISGIEILCLNDKCNSSNVRFSAGSTRHSTAAYPNPFQNEVKVKLSDNEEEEGGRNLKIKLFNSMGGILEESEMKMEKRNEFLEFDLSHLPVGIYFLNVQSEVNGVNETFKLIKQ